ncbi:MAG: hypothetical protein WC044_05695 [Crocinitomicaceae bacterium]
MKLPLTTLIFLIILGVVSCKKQKENPKYSFVSIQLENGSSEEKYPAQSSSASINSSVYCMLTRLNLQKVITTSNYVDNRLAMQNSTPIQSFVITSNVDFNASLLAGDTLNSLFGIYNNDYFNVKNLDEFSSSDFQNITYYNDGPFYFDRFLLLKEKPTVLGTRKFYVKMTSPQNFYYDSVEVDLY